MAQLPGDASRFYVIERAGMVRVFDNVIDPPSSAVVADLRARVNSEAGGEAGLLGLAFHPDVLTNRYVFLSYTGFITPGVNSELRTIVSRFTMAADFLTLDPGSEKEIFTVDQPYANHNGGGIAFDAEGYLVIGLGDGGSGGDPGNRAQNPNSLLGKFLRLDVDNGDPYSIPPTNPFATDGGAPEIYALGFRNPWRWSFDRQTGELWAGDVGQGNWEEVDQVVLGGNYGWRYREGAHCYNPSSGCPTAGLIEPVAEYSHSFGQSITGGYVYRGADLPELQGKFLFADYVSKRVWAVGTQPGDQMTELFIATANIPSFAQDESGELYIVGYDGGIYKLVRASGTPPPAPLPAMLSQTGCFESTDPKRPGPGLIPYDVRAPLWSDGAQKERHLALPDGAKIQVNEDGDWVFPPGTVLTKTFLLGGKRVETRLFMRHPDGVWAGYSYEWDDAETNATLLDDGKTKTVGSQTWTFPSRTDCFRCHTAAAGYALGLETGQLNHPLTYAATGRTSNQVATLEAIGLFESGLGTKDTWASYPDPQGAGALEPRARAYLHANCSMCHRPGGGGGGAHDLRYATSFADAKLCNVSPSGGDFGVAGAKLVVPGTPGQSLVSLRMHFLGTGRMPPLASAVVDTEGTSVVDGWITSLSACPP
jgi:uncharacterized repeat protein (TIGR03806 family)